MSGTAVITPPPFAVEGANVITAGVVAFGFTHWTQVLSGPAPASPLAATIDGTDNTIIKLPSGVYIATTHVTFNMPLGFAPGTYIRVKVSLNGNDASVEGTLDNEWVIEGNGGNSLTLDRTDTGFVYVSSASNVPGIGLIQTVIVDSDDVTPVGFTISNSILYLLRIAP